MSPAGRDWNGAGRIGLRFLCEGGDSNVPPRDGEAAIPPGRWTESDAAMIALSVRSARHSGGLFFRSSLAEPPLYKRLEARAIPHPRSPTREGAQARAGKREEEAGGHLSLRWP